MSGQSWTQYPGIEYNNMQLRQRRQSRAQQAQPQPQIPQPSQRTPSSLPSSSSSLEASMITEQKANDVHSDINTPQTNNTTITTRTSTLIVKSTSNNVVNDTKSNRSLSHSHCHFHSSSSSSIITSCKSNSNSNGNSLNQEDFECPICYELLCEPVTLLCGHSYCQHCIFRWILEKPHASCPNCNTRIRLFEKIESELKSFNNGAQNNNDNNNNNNNKQLNVHIPIQTSYTLRGMLSSQFSNEYKSRMIDTQLQRQYYCDLLNTRVFNLKQQYEQNSRSSSITNIAHSYLDSLNSFILNNINAILLIIVVLLTTAVLILLFMPQITRNQWTINNDEFLKGLRFQRGGNFMNDYGIHTSNIHSNGNSRGGGFFAGLFELTNWNNIKDSFSELMTDFIDLIENGIAAISAVLGSFSIDKLTNITFPIPSAEWLNNEYNWMSDLTSKQPANVGRSNVYYYGGGNGEGEGNVKIEGSALFDVYYIASANLFDNDELNQLKLHPNDLLEQSWETEELKKYLKANRIDYSTCVEKRCLAELVYKDIRKQSISDVRKDNFDFIEKYLNEFEYNWKECVDSDCMIEKAASLQTLQIIEYKSQPAFRQNIGNNKSNSKKNNENKNSHNKNDKKNSQKNQKSRQKNGQFANDMTDVMIGMFLENNPFISLLWYIFNIFTNNTTA